MIAEIIGHVGKSDDNSGSVAAKEFSSVQKYIFSSVTDFMTVRAFRKQVKKHSASKMRKFSCCIMRPFLLHLKPDPSFLKICLMLFKTMKLD